MDVLRLNRYLFIYLFIIFVSNTEFLEKQLHRSRAFPNELKCGAYSGAALIQIKTVLSLAFINLPAQFPFFFSKNEKKANGQQMHKGIGREEVAEP